MARALPLGVAVFVLTMASAIGCARSIDPIGTTCGDDRDCLAGEICSGGVCASGGVTTCVTDLDCDPSAGEVCSSGICAVPRSAGDGQACTATADCPISTFCNTAQGLCAPLLEGWCRQDAQCGADVPFCSNAEQGESVPGRCVECLADADCGSGTCQQPGLCVVDNACPDNASPVVGGTCRCNAGFTDDGAGGCRPAGGGTTPTDPGPTDPGPGPTEPVDPGPSTGQSCVEESDCFESVGFEYTCGAAGECICDVPFLMLFCDAVDEQICDCAGSSTGAPDLDAECFEDLDCDLGLSCIFSSAAGTFDPGVCKKECEVDGDCSDVGLECMEDVLADGIGICADVQQRGETCETSVYAEDLTGSQMCDGSGTAILDCFSSRCEQVCDWQGRTGQRPQCAAGTTCGSLQFRAEAGTSVAVCQ